MLDDVTHLVPTDPRYPALLAAIPSPPELDVRGALEPGDALAIAIVGARQATAYGLEVAESLAAELAARGWPAIWVARCSPCRAASRRRRAGARTAS